MPYLGLPLKRFIVILKITSVAVEVAALIKINAVELSNKFREQIKI